jgi:hypothetical protein
MRAGSNFKITCMAPEFADSSKNTDFGCASGNKLLCRGWSPDNRFLKIVDIYDVTTGAWTLNQVEG